MGRLFSENNSLPHDSALVKVSPVPWVSSNCSISEFAGQCCWKLIMASHQKN
jgi:hypothetical protein